MDPAAELGRDPVSKHQVQPEYGDDECCCLKKNQNAPRPSDVVSHIQRIGCQPEKTTLHGGQSRSWSAEQGKENKRNE